MKRVHDTAADQEFNALLTISAVKALLAPRMVTYAVSSVRAYCADLLRYTNAGTVTGGTAPATSPTTPARAKSCLITSPARTTSGCSPGRKARKAAAKAWRRTCSGPRPSTGSMRQRHDTTRQRAPACRGQYLNASHGRFSSGAI